MSPKKVIIVSMNLITFLKRERRGNMQNTLMSMVCSVSNYISLYKKYFKRSNAIIFLTSKVFKSPSYKEAVA